MLRQYFSQFISPTSTNTSRPSQSSSSHQSIPTGISSPSTTFFQHPSHQYLYSPATTSSSQTSSTPFLTQYPPPLSSSPSTLSPPPHFPQISTTNASNDISHQFQPPHDHVFVDSHQYSSDIPQTTQFSISNHEPTNFSLPSPQIPSQSPSHSTIASFSSNNFNEQPEEPVYTPPKAANQFHPPWYFQLISGAVAGGTAAFVVSPLDVARIRIQIAPLDAPVGPFGINIIRSIVRKEGWLSLVSGLPTNMFALIPNWMSYFLAYSQFRTHASPILVPMIGTTPFDVVNALFAGGVSTFCTHPLWLVKARFQVQGLKRRFGAGPQPTHLTGYVDSTANHMYQGTFDALIKIARAEGFKGLYSGFLSQLLGLLHVGIHFPVYEALKRQLYMYNCKQSIKKHNNMSSNEGNQVDICIVQPPDVAVNLLDSSLPNHLSASQIVIASTISKIIACSLAYPHEILRSRFQTQEFLASTNSKYEKREKYTSIVQALRSIVHTEGIKGLYRGLDVTLIRSVPACIVTFVMYEETMRMLRKYSKLDAPKQSNIYQ